MKHLKLIFLSLIGLIFFMGDMHMSEAGGRGRRYREDAGLTEKKKTAPILPTETLKDQNTQKEMEKTKSTNTKMQSHTPASKVKACDHTIPRYSQPGCVEQ